MAAPSWNISGQYFETCSCDYVCPCILGQMAVRPDEGFVHIRDGDAGRTRHVWQRPSRRCHLHRPRIHARGDGEGQLVCRPRRRRTRDGRTTRRDRRHRERRGRWSHGAVVGPHRKVSGRRGRAHQIRAEGNRGTVTAGALVDMAAEGAMGIDPSVTEPMFIDNTGHPVSSHLARPRIEEPRHGAWLDVGR